jgi:DNA-directed RNA polymerase omega subunit
MSKEKLVSMNQRGLCYPSIDDLSIVIHSKYRLAVAAGKLARQIEKEKLIFDETICYKSVGNALEEILKGKLEIHFIE